MISYLVENFQVRIWGDTHSSIRRLACYACGSHWFYAYGIQFTISFFFLATLSLQISNVIDIETLST